MSQVKLDLAIEDVEDFGPPPPPNRCCWWRTWI